MHVSRTNWLWIAKIAGAAALAVAGVTVALHRSPPPAAVPAAAVAPAPAAHADAKLPPAAQSDATVREALNDLTPRSLFRKWLAADDLLNRLTVVAVNLAEDQSPAAQLEFLRPRRAFSVSRDGPETVISPRSAARYDAFANVISSIDAKKAAAAYRALHPLLESAYHALGYPGRPLDAVATQALQRVTDAPVREHAAVRESGAHWVFTDPALEKQGAVEKQLLRMGPRNTRLLQEEARELASAIGLTLRQPAQAAAR